MNISRRRRRRVFEDEDEHMINKKKKKKKKKKKNKGGGDDIVEYCSNSHINNNIPGDLIVEILLRLPPASVVRFQHVCKQWYSLISKTDFQRTHSSSSFKSQDQQHPITITDQFLVFETTTRVEFLPLTLFEEEKQLHLKLFHGLSPRPPGELVELGLYSPRPHSQRFPMVSCSLMDSCNGLFLYHGFFFDEHGKSDYVKQSFYICNPITKKYLKLPNIMDEHKREKRSFKTVKIVFDPSISHSYKVQVLMVSWNGCLVERHTEYWHMYSSETGTWRLFRTRSFDSTFTDYSDCSISVLLNGVLYWPYWRTTTDDTSLCFDVDKERLGFLPLPPKPKHYYVRNCNYFGKCDGRLQLIETLVNPGTDRDNCFNQIPCSFDVMETEPQKQEDGSVCCTWILKYRVNDITRIDDLFSKDLFTYDILHCYKMKNRRGENEQVLIFLSLTNKNNFDGSFGRSLDYFSLTNNKFIKELADSERGTRNFEGNAFPYTPTLFPVS